MSNDEIMREFETIKDTLLMIENSIKSEKRLYVPENIKLAEGIGDRFSHGIINEEGQCLFKFLDSTWSVHTKESPSNKRAYLRPLKEGEDKTNKLIYCEDVNLRNIGIIRCYKLFLNNNDYVYFDEGSIYTGYDNWEYKYVVEFEDE